MSESVRMAPVEELVALKAASPSAARCDATQTISAWTDQLRQDKSSVESNPADADAWWRMGAALHHLDQGSASSACFQRALQLDLAQQPTVGRGHALVLNCERRFVGHEAPFAAAIGAEGGSHLVCADTGAFEEAIRRAGWLGGRVYRIDLGALYALIRASDLSRVGVVLTATPRAVPELPSNVRTALVSHDLVGFGRDDLLPFEQLDPDGQESIARFCAFDAYLMGTRLAADDLTHRVRFYRNQIPIERRYDRPARDPASHQWLVPAGYPRLDQNIARFEERAAREDPDSILLAPTERGCNPGTWTSAELESLIDTLGTAFPSRNVIVRPHPYDLERHANAFAQLRARFAEYPRVRWDDGLDYLVSWVRSATMVTDTSGTAWNYAWTTLRPVVHFCPRQAEMDALYDSRSAWGQRHRIGETAESLEQLTRSLSRLDRNGADLDSHLDEPRRRARDEMLFHPGTSAAYVAQHLDAIHSGEGIADWETI